MAVGRLIRPEAGQRQSPSDAEQAIRKDQHRPLQQRTFRGSPASLGNQGRLLLPCPAELCRGRCAGPRCQPEKGKGMT